MKNSLNYRVGLLLIGTIICGAIAGCGQSADPDELNQLNIDKAKGAPAPPPEALKAATAKPQK